MTVQIGCVKFADHNMKPDLPEDTIYHVGISGGKDSGADWVFQWVLRVVHTFNQFLENCPTYWVS